MQQGHQWNVEARRGSALLVVSKELAFCVRPLCGSNFSNIASGNPTLCKSACRFAHCERYFTRRLI